MKKVRYAIGALGIAPVMVLPFTNGAAAAAHVSGNSAKRVTLTAEQRPAVAAVTCHHQADHNATNSGVSFAQYVDWSGTNCVYQALGKLGVRLSGLEMRTRAYSRPGGTRVYSNINKNGHEHGLASTSFLTTLNVHAGQVCIALLEQNNGDLNQGPICVNT
jgi:hypothetical protein